MDDSQYQQSQQTQMSVDAYTTESALRYRLDTEQLRHEIRLFLQGKTEELQRQENRLVQVTKDVGRRLANDVGIQRIMARLAFILNSSVVQGNLTTDRYEVFMERTRKSLAKHVFVNLYDYDIKEEEYDFVVDNIMDAVELFVSRTINDGERRSYTGWMIHNERTDTGRNNKPSMMDRLRGKT